MSDQFIRYNKRQSIVGQAARLKSEVEELREDNKILFEDCEQSRRERDEWRQRRDLAIQRAEKAEGEAAKLKQDLQQAVDQVAEDNAMLRAALKKLEWYGYRTHDLRQCLVCFSLKREGRHRPDCFIAQALGIELAKKKEANHEP